MADEYAERYKLSPEWVKDNIDQYDYYEMLLMEIQSTQARDFILEKKRNEKPK